MIRVILFVLIPSLLFGQNFIGCFEVDTDVYLNETIVQYFRDNIDKIESFQEKEKANIPYVKTFKAGESVIFIDGYPYQYTIDENFENVNVSSLKCSLLEFDFKKKEIKIKHEDNDNNDDIKEKDINKLKEKIKVKHAKIKKHKKP